MKTSVLILTILGLAAATCTLIACSKANESSATSAQTAPIPSQKTYEPLKLAEASAAAFREIGDKGIINWESPVPSMCYTKTDGISNPCWTCHTDSVLPNEMKDWELQEEYAFSDVALHNHWDNLFIDRRPTMAKISDTEATQYIRQDNYSLMRNWMLQWEGKETFAGWRWDLDLMQGFDNEGFAKDGSWWRAIRYKPFLGTFWPTNGNTDDVMIRLAPEFRKTEDGVESKAIYKINLAILEAIMTVDPDKHLAREYAAVSRQVEPIDEAVAGVDLNADGTIGGIITTIVGIPSSYVGAAKDKEIDVYKYPVGTEFVHTVRYVDSDAPGLLSTRVKEVRYSRKLRWFDDWGTTYEYSNELDAKLRGKIPEFGGSPIGGLVNDFGWQYQGYIEDRDGRLRLQTVEETRFCMGCHNSIGVTVDSSFGFPRKAPGAEGWKHQYLVGMKDVPQAGHAEPEVLTYFKRVRGGDEFRNNDEVLANFFNAQGEPNAVEVLRAAPGGDKDLAWLLTPSRERALQLTKAYMALIREGDLLKGRDTMTKPAINVHPEIENGDTALKETGQIYKDGRLWLNWDWSGLSESGGK